MATKWATVLADLRQKIESGEFKAGEPIPSTAELRTSYGISSTTVRRVLTELTRVGLIETTVGVGSVVRAPKRFRLNLTRIESPSATVVPNADPWAAEAIREGFTPRETVQVSIELPSKRVADLLELQPSDEVVVRKRKRWRDDVLLELTQSFFPKSIVEGTPLMHPESVQIAGGVLASVGKPQARIVESLSVRWPSEEEATSLELRTGSQVIERLRVGFAADGTVLRAMFCVHPAEITTLVYEMDLM